MPFRITTWNVNGIRNPFGYKPWSDTRTFSAMFDILESDLVIMQELKIQRKDLRDDMVIIPGWDCYFSLPKHKKGYSGVAIYTRTAKCSPIRAEEGILGVLNATGTSTPYRELPDSQSIGGYMTDEELEDLGVDPLGLDAEGRCVILEFPAFVVIGVYSPANSNGLRDDFRSGFLIALDSRIRKLTRAGKRVILAGDLNVSRDELDTAGSEDDKRKAGISHEEYMSTINRRRFNQMLQGGEVFNERDPGCEEPVLWDSTRAFHKGRKGMYTHWEQKMNARPGNYGSRIDYVLCSIPMASWAVAANIQEGLFGSDHCPVYVEFSDEVDIDGKKTHIFDILNPPGLFENGRQIVPDSSRVLPAFSGKLYPEFDKRRTIRDMFARPKSAKAAEKPADKASDMPTDLGVVPTLPTSSLQPTLASTQSAVQATMQQSPKDETATTSKRKVSGNNGIQASNKKTKTGNGAATDKPTEQKTIGSFFKSKTSAVSPQKSESEGPSTPARSPMKGVTPGTNSFYEELIEAQLRLTSPTNSAFSHTDDENRKLIASFGASMTDGDQEAQQSQQPQQPPPKLQPSAFDQEDPEADRQANSLAWSSLFTKPIAPRCGSHSEPCTQLETKKKGFNCGRKFWICARPVGPSGEKESGTQWRCKTFIWSSDWNSKGSEGKNGGTSSMGNSPTKGGGG